MSGIRAVRKELAEAPAGALRNAWIDLGAVALVVGWAVWDVLLGGGDVLHWTAGVVGSVGLLLHTVSDVLHRTGRQRGGPGGAVPSERFRSPVLRSTYLVLPRWALGGALLLAVATGLHIVIALTHFRFWLVAALFGYFAFRASATVLASARELYSEASAQHDRAERSRREATEAHLLALQAQMNPHFLFNALNTVASLARTDPRAAERTTEALASVLRQTLRRSESLMGTVEEEVGFVEAYLDVERQRWGERLEVEWDVDREALDARLPPMTLQPLVENALLHGLGARLEGGTVRISLRREEGIVVVTVADDGPGMGPDAREGTGLGNLRERLDTLYRERASVDVDSSRSGTTVRLRVPSEPPRDLRNANGHRADVVPCAS